MRRLTGFGLSLLAAGAIVQAQQGATMSTVRAARASASPSIAHDPARLLPGTRPNVFTTIQGNALSSTNGPLPNAAVRLRDARFGRIVDVQLTDKMGLFTFKNIDPGSYIVEALANDQTVLAASQMLNVGAGQLASAVVKLPWRMLPLVQLTGHTMASALAVSSAAAASGVLAQAVVGQPATATEP